MDNNLIFSRNLQRLMETRGKSRYDLCDELGLNYYTLSDWILGRKYPRMDKVELLAKYFGVLKSDLIEERTEEHWKRQERMDALAKITIRAQRDADFFDDLQTFAQLDPEKRKAIIALIK